mgnify:FL=1
MPQRFEKLVAMARITWIDYQHDAEGRLACALHDRGPDVPLYAYSEGFRTRNRTGFYMSDNNQTAAGTGKIVRSVKRAILVLELLSERHRLNATEITKTTGFPKSTVHDLLATLESERLVHRDPDSNRFSLGFKLFGLGNAARLDMDLRRIAYPYLQEINRRLDETAQLAVLDGYEVVYLEAIESSKRLRTYSVIGVRAPAYCSAVGKSILAFRPADEVDDYLSRVELEPFTETTITDPDTFRAELETVRQRGFGIDDREHEEWVRCLGAPIMDFTGHAVAGISITGPSQRLSEERDRELIAPILDATRAISERIGHSSGFDAG